jgi:hypothetical protein
VSDLRHPKSKRADVTAVVLAVFGLAGLSVSAGGLLGGPALWPSFSGERVYTAQFAPSDGDAHTPPTAAHAAPRKKPASDELALRVINEAARGVCQGEARARRAAQTEVNRRQRRARQSSRRNLTLLTAAASGRPANS